VTLGTLLLVLGLYLVFFPLRTQTTARPTVQLSAERRSLIGAIGGAYLGVISSILGIGGGILHVPFLIRCLDFPPHIATATSHFVLVIRSEEHTSELQSPCNLVCRLLLEKK